MTEERYQRSERALVGALAEMYVQGVSTRKVKRSPRSCAAKAFRLLDQCDQPAAG